MSKAQALHRHRTLTVDRRGPDQIAQDDHRSFTLLNVMTGDAELLFPYADRDRDYGNAVVLLGALCDRLQVEGPYSRRQASDCHSTRFRVKISRPPEFAERRPRLSHGSCTIASPGSCTARLVPFD